MLITVQQNFLQLLGADSPLPSTHSHSAKQTCLYIWTFRGCRVLTAAGRKRRKISEPSCTAAPAFFREELWRPQRPAPSQAAHWEANCSQELPETDRSASSLCPRLLPQAGNPLQPASRSQLPSAGRGLLSTVGWAVKGNWFFHSYSCFQPPKTLFTVINFYSTF